MPEVSATDAARNFSDILDAVEHRGERFTIVRWLFDEWPQPEAVETVAFAAP